MVFYRGTGSLGESVLQALEHLSLDGGSSLLSVRAGSRGDLLGLSEVGADSLCKLRVDEQ